MCQLFMKVSGSLAVYVQIFQKTQLSFFYFDWKHGIFEWFLWSIFSLGGELAAAAQATAVPHSSRSSPKLNLSNELSHGIDGGATRREKKKELGKKDRVSAGAEVRRRPYLTWLMMRLEAAMKKSSTLSKRLPTGCVCTVWCETLPLAWLITCSTAVGEEGGR